MTLQINLTESSYMIRTLTRKECVYSTYFPKPYRQSKTIVRNFLSNLPKDYMVICPRYQKTSTGGNDIQIGVSGKMRKDETTLPALIREFSEEIGVSLTDAKDLTPFQICREENTLLYIYMIPISKAKGIDKDISLKSNSNDNYTRRVYGILYGDYESSRNLLSSIGKKREISDGIDRTCAVPVSWILSAI